MVLLWVAVSAMLVQQMDRHLVRGSDLSLALLLEGKSVSLWGHSRDRELGLLTEVLLDPLTDSVSVPLTPRGGRQQAEVLAKMMEQLVVSSTIQLKPTSGRGKVTLLVMALALPMVRVTVQLMALGSARELDPMWTHQWEGPSVHSSEQQKVLQSRCFVCPLIPALAPALAQPLAPLTVQRMDHVWVPSSARHSAPVLAWPSALALDLGWAHKYLHT
jgi:hypothetical protein